MQKFPQGIATTTAAMMNFADTGLFHVYVGRREFPTAHFSPAAAAAAE
jgi:hypothetical protein